MRMRRGGQTERTGWVRGRKGWVWLQRLNSTAALVNLPALLQLSHTLTHTVSVTSALQSHTHIVTLLRHGWHDVMLLFLSSHHQTLTTHPFSSPSTEITPSPVLQFSRDQLVSVSSAWCAAVGPAATISGHSLRQHWPTNMQFFDY